MYSRCVNLTSYIQQAQIFFSLDEHSTRKLQKQEMCIKEKKAFQIKSWMHAIRKGNSEERIISAYKQLSVTFSQLWEIFANVMQIQ